MASMRQALLSQEGLFHFAEVVGDRKCPFVSFEQRFSDGPTALVEINVGAQLRTCKPSLVRNDHARLILAMWD